MASPKVNCPFCGGDGIEIMRYASREFAYKCQCTERDFPPLFQDGSAARRVRWIMALRDEADALG